MINFLLQHQFWVAVVLYWIFSAAISALPEPSRSRARASRPEPNGSPGYLWLYRFLHTTAGNLTTAFNRLPGMKPFILLLLVPLVLSTTACAALIHTSIVAGRGPATIALTNKCAGRLLVAQIHDEYV